MIIGTPQAREGEGVAALEARLAALLTQGARGLLILVGEGCAISQREWDSLLQGLPVPVAGGIFPRVLCEETVSRNGVIAVGLRHEPVLHVLDRLDQSALQACRDLPCSLDGCGTVMLWFDGLACRVSPMIEHVYDRLGPQPRYIGGGAGSMERRRACVFSNRGVLQDAAVLMGLSAHLGIGARHGWRHLFGPYLVSEAHGHEIHSLDFRPAAQVYGEQLTPLLRQEETPASSFEYSRSYPFGIERMDGSFLVRDPLRRTGDTLICVGDVPNQASLHILHGERADLMQALVDAWHDAQGNCSSAPVAALLVDCMSSGLHAGDSYPEHLQALRTRMVHDGQHIPLFGVLSLGEIGSALGVCLELHNKTSVLGLWPDADA
ncbi:MAG: hypothetical protein CGU28_06030 [Candidatus Dactylopiibacterium carminicum]|uniref:Histidine kinase n=1 Tax=Candidatus Dactylopiibacterium carminicum TaxID=857335 RepID=A0A272EQR8_9RHOO|nr:FIST C-terminal domain-containing protein [Candidatus Dactylopiibacterium carminicum]KAF7599270.1 hypothetical protein BGI27_08790 [Candidatus Dactylopiibacterium carminicum]PAS92432.1 MAG: hypothetical protein CGU29_11510 [Candidatus Dactylopiibacterium carminicum]PAS97180.1 MAG: hypothetical protein CGU28_06030 [Candidatus Dactylopiibacterium carminicum]PAS99277.1 MAG: hypothetical protein BSR46_08825 [Candidatus Dactylopiibacterium carminicum]